MPHTNRKKRSSANSGPTATTTKPTIVHTKRQEFQDDDGWTHVVDTPRSRRGPKGTTTRTARSAAANLNSNANSNPALLHTAGDFEINGVSYVDRTLAELRADFEFWKKGWEESEAYRVLKGRLLGTEEMCREVKRGQEEIEAEEKTEEGERLMETPKVETEHEVRKEDTFGEIGGDEATGTEDSTAVEAVAPAAKTSEKLKVDNIIVLGLGSLQSARREGRRASATQLAALQTIIQTLGGGKDIKVAFQEPHFTTLDKELLTSLGYEVVEDPQAFSMIAETSLVYAIHCYAQVYKSVSEAKRPAILIGTDIENFWKFNLSETAESLQHSLEEMVKGCEVSAFPQLRHDFSDTKIYWRTAPGIAL